MCRSHRQLLLNDSAHGLKSAHGTMCPNAYICTGHVRLDLIMVIMLLASVLQHAYTADAWTVTCQGRLSGI